MLEVVGVAQSTRAETAALDIELFDEGPRNGPAILLLHGWPEFLHER